MTTGKPIEGNASVILTATEPTPQQINGGFGLNTNNAFGNNFVPRTFTIEKALGYVSTDDVLLSELYGK
jgi:hypothetical protein